MASSCSSSETSSSGFEHGSGISDNAVTICVGTISYQPGTSETKTSVVSTKSTGKATAKKKQATKAPAPAAKPIAKAPQPVKVIVESCPTAKQFKQMPTSADARQRWIQNLCSPQAATNQSKPKVTAAPVAKPKPTPKTQVSKKVVIETKTQAPRLDAKNGNAQFVSNKLLASNYPSTPLKINQPTQFSANAVLHFRSGSIIGKQAEVKFVPALVSWDFGDSSQGKGNAVGKSYSEAGVYLVTASVTYSVSYRLVGETSWQQVSGGITTQSNQLWVYVDQGSTSISETKAEVPLLVGEPCMKALKVFGCKT